MHEMCTCASGLTAVVVAIESETHTGNKGAAILCVSQRQGRPG